MSRKVIELDGLADTTPHHYSPAIVANGTLYISGQVGTDAEGNYVGDDIESQTRLAETRMELEWSAATHSRTHGNRFLVR